MIKKLMKALSFVLFTVLIFSACSAVEPEVMLTEEEVALLREENGYIIYGEITPENASVSGKRITFREFIMDTETFVYCEVIKDPEYVEVDTENTFNLENHIKPKMRVHTIKIISDSEGIYSKGDVITFYYGLAGQDDCPSPKKGEKILIPMRDSYNEKIGDGKSSYYGYYYVSEKGNVISAFKEEEKSVYSGETVNDMLKMLKKTDLERKTYLEEKIRMYERSGGAYGFTSIEMLREQIKEKLEARKNAEK